MAIVSILCMISLSVVHPLPREAVIRTVVTALPWKIFMCVHCGLPVEVVVVLRGVFVCGDLF